MRNDDDPMNECSAALVLMSLSCSPHSPNQWSNTANLSLMGGNGGLGTSPGGCSTSSWSSSDASSLSDECATSTSSSSRIRTTSLSMSDEGIVMDYNEETPRKRRVSKYFILFLVLYLNLNKKFYENINNRLGIDKIHINVKATSFRCLLLYIVEIDKPSSRPPYKHRPPTLNFIFFFAFLAHNNIVIVLYKFFLNSNIHIMRYKYSKITFNVVAVLPK